MNAIVGIWCCHIYSKLFIILDAKHCQCIWFQMEMKTFPLSESCLPVISTMFRSSDPNITKTIPSIFFGVLVTCFWSIEIFNNSKTKPPIAWWFIDSYLPEGAFNKRWLACSKTMSIIFINVKLDLVFIFRHSKPIIGLDDFNIIKGNGSFFSF